MKEGTTWKEMENLFEQIQFAKDAETTLMEEGRVLDANEIAYYTDSFYPWDVVKEILEDKEGVVVKTIPPVAEKKQDYYYRCPDDAVTKSGESLPYVFTSVDQDEPVRVIKNMLSVLQEKGFIFEKEAVKATNVKQITLDIAAPADWDGEKFLGNLLSGHGLLVLGSNQEDLTDEYQKQNGFGYLKKDGTYGDFSLKKEHEPGEISYPCKVKIPGISIVHSEGFRDGTESAVTLYSSVRECVDLSYENYTDTWEGLYKQGEVELRNGRYVDCNGNVCLSKEEYETELLRDGYLFIQLDSYHIQFEYFEKELELNKENFIAGMGQEEKKDEISMNTPNGDNMEAVKTEIYNWLNNCHGELDVESEEYKRAVSAIKELCSRKFPEFYESVFSNSDDNFIFSAGDGEFILYYYNPDSNAGGQIVECPFDTDGARRLLDGEELMDVLAENTQYLSDINTIHFFNTLLEIIESKEEGCFLGTDVLEVCKNYKVKNSSLDQKIAAASFDENKLEHHCGLNDKGQVPNYETER